MLLKKILIIASTFSLSLYASEQIRIKTAAGHIVRCPLSIQEGTIEKLHRYKPDLFIQTTL